MRQFLQTTDPSQLSLTDFSLYSIGIILTRLKKDALFLDFLSDTIEESGVTRVHLSTRDLRQLLAIRQQLPLDFDDAYQYVAAEKQGFVLVSFDSDFDHTTRGRKTPAEVIQARS